MSNAGPLLPADMWERLFESMVLMRKEWGSGPHLGLCRHIARLIAEFHSGRISVANREDASGVVVTPRFTPGAAN